MHTHMQDMVEWRRSWLSRHGFLIDGYNFARLGYCYEVLAMMYACVTSVIVGASMVFVGACDLQLWLLIVAHMGRLVFRYA